MSYGFGYIGKREGSKIVYTDYSMMLPVQLAYDAEEGYHYNRKQVLKNIKYINTKWYGSVRNKIEWKTASSIKDYLRDGADWHMLVTKNNMFFINKNGTLKSLLAKEQGWHKQSFRHSIASKKGHFKRKVTRAR